MADPRQLPEAYAKDHERKVFSVGDPGCEIVRDEINALGHFNDPFKVPLNQLPWRADEASADFWDPDWPEDQQRRAIDAQWFIHRHKGPAPAVIFALSLLGIRAYITPWFKMIPEGVPGTFDVIGELDDAPLFSDKLWRLAFAAIDRSKSLSRHYTLRMLSSKSAPVFAGVVPMVRLFVTVQPFEFDPPVVEGQARVAVQSFWRLFITAEPQEMT